MKVLVIILVLAFSVGWAMAQAPLAIPFQGAVRNANNVLIGNKTISIRFSIHNGFSFGNIIYREWQTTVTNTQGLFVLNLGQGNAEIGQFSSINWSDSTKFMQVEIDTTNSKSVWRDIGTQQMLSVPYALSASNGVPVGTIEAFGGDSSKVPLGWALCDGTPHDTTDIKWKALYNIIGFAWGFAKKKAQFKLPFTNGLFLRGIDNGHGNDPDAGSRQAIGDTTFFGNIGDNIGSVQQDAFKIHHHDANLKLGAEPLTGGARASTAAGGHGAVSPSWISSSLVIDAGQSIETRPKNVYVNYIIKY